MKELNLKIKTCQDCPYATVRNMGFICTKNGGEKVCNLDDHLDKIGIPEWCPLKNCSDPGVKVGLTAMVVRDGKVLLGERKNTETASGLYAYPGGRMDYGEEPIDGVLRELKEETGLIASKEDVRFLRFVNEFFPESNKHYVSMVFMIKNSQGEPELKEPDKCKGWKWFSPFSIPDNTFIPCAENIVKYKNEF